MSGHNKWSKIKYKKGAADAKKSATFSKIISLISSAAKKDPNPQTNSKLRAFIDQAKKEKVPLDTINRALSKALERKDQKEFIMEVYGPESVAILVIAKTDNTKRTAPQLKKIVLGLGAKVADPGSVLWAFSEPTAELGWQAKFPQSVSLETQEKINNLTAKIAEHPEVKQVITNAVS